MQKQTIKQKALRHKIWIQFALSDNGKLSRKHSKPQLKQKIVALLSANLKEVVSLDAKLGKWNDNALRNDNR